MEIIRGLLNAVIAIAIVDAVSSWFLPLSDFPRSITAPLLAPIYAPIRDIIGNSLGGLDISAILLVIVCQLIQSKLKAAPGGLSR